MILNMIRLSQRKARVWKHKTLEQIGSVLTSLHEVHHLSATSLKCCVRARKSGVTFSLGAITALLTDWYLPQVESFPSAGETTLPRRCDSCSGSLILFRKNGGYFTGTLAWEARWGAPLVQDGASLSPLNAWEDPRAFPRTWQTVRDWTDMRSRKADEATFCLGLPSHLSVRVSHAESSPHFQCHRSS